MSWVIPTMERLVMVILWNYLTEKKMKETSIILYTSYYDILNKMPKDDVCDIIMACLEHVMGMEKRALSDKAEIAFAFISSNINRDKEKYERIKERRSEAGRKGGAPKGNRNAMKLRKQTSDNEFNQNKQKQAKQTNESKTSLYDNDNVNDNGYINTSTDVDDLMDTTSTPNVVDDIEKTVSSKDEPEKKFSVSDSGESKTSQTHIQDEETSTTNAEEVPPEKETPPQPVKPAPKVSKEEQTFIDGMKKTYPHVMAMKSPLTYDQYKRIIAKYENTDLVKSVLEAMENKNDLRLKYRSANLTLQEWIRRRITN